MPRPEMNIDEVDLICGLTTNGLPTAASQLLRIYAPLGLLEAKEYLEAGFAQGNLRESLIEDYVVSTSEILRSEKDKLKDQLARVHHLQDQVNEPRWVLHSPDGDTR